MRKNIRRAIKRLVGRPDLIAGVLVEAHVELKRCSFVGPVLIGLRSYANDSLFRNVLVGRYCSIGRRCSIGAARHNIDGLTTHPYGAPASFSSDPQTVIGNDVWIGDNVVIMAGLTIGDGAVIGAGTILTKDVSPYAIVVGVPGKEIRRRFDEQIITRLVGSKWWRYGDEFVEHWRKEGRSLAMLDQPSDHSMPLVPPHHTPFSRPK